MSISYSDLSDDDLTEMAQASYRRQGARAQQKTGECWPILPAHCWVYEEEADRISVAAYKRDEIVRLHWTGSRFTPAKFATT